LSKLRTKRSPQKFWERERGLDERIKGELYEKERTCGQEGTVGAGNRQTSNDTRQEGKSTQKSREKASSATERKMKNKEYWAKTGQLRRETHSRRVSIWGGEREGGGESRRGPTRKKGRRPVGRRCPGCVREKRLWG